MPRIVGEFLARKWGQAVIIENKSGAGGNVGADAAYHSDPDGYVGYTGPQGGAGLPVYLQQFFG
jgi:tripartite-type tricarboxylate transporter receptor subunit TctC